MANQPPTRADVPLSLAMAMVFAAPVPVLLLDGQLNVVAASLSFSQTFGIARESAVGRPVLRLGDGEWDVPQLHSLLDATISGVANIASYEMDLASAGKVPRRLTLNAQKLHYDDLDEIRVLLTIVDVTDARAAERLKNDLIGEKNVLLQEMQHRIANSLQIIASVIMQTARGASSDETRGELQNAHQRVMSVATLQQQLTQTPKGDIDLHQYFTKLCNSISASMISEHSGLSLTTTGGHSAVKAEISASLGLIVTELVINALKHAFPRGQGGTILVNYQTQGLDWTLSVADDGVGMPLPPLHARTGLGTTIIEALAKQLHAKVSVADARPGTKVSVVHEENAQ